MLTDLLLGAPTVLGVTLLDCGTGVILLAHADLGAVYSVLAVEDVGAVEYR